MRAPVSLLLLALAPALEGSAQCVAAVVGQDSISLKCLDADDAWRTLPGTITSGIDACTDASGSLRLAARGTDGAAWVFDARSESWLSLGGTLLDGDPAIACPPDGSVHVFGRGADEAIWHARVGDPAWESLGGVLPSGVDAIAASGAIHVVARGMDDAAWMTSHDGASWSGWTSLGGELVGDPSIAAVGERLIVFARGAGGDLVARDVNGQAAWRSLGASAASSLDATSDGRGGAWIAMVGAQGEAQLARTDGHSLEKASSLGGKPASSVAIVASAGPSKPVTSGKGSEAPSPGKAPETDPYIVVPGRDEERASKTRDEQRAPKERPPEPSGNDLADVRMDTAESGIPDTGSREPPVARLPDLTAGEIACGNLSFERDLECWTATGGAFAAQPSTTTSLPASHVMRSMRLDEGGIGGDYWTGTRVPIGVDGERSISTGNPDTGTLTSREGRIPARWLSFLVGGTRDEARVRVEIQRRHATGWTTLRSATGNDSSILRREAWDLAQVLSADELAAGSVVARLLVSDESPSGHVEVDGFVFSDEAPETIAVTENGREVLRDPTLPLWGFADTHAHPMNYLAFGGVIMAGEPFGPASSALATCNGTHGPGGSGDAIEGPHLVGGWPTFDGWPRFSSKTHQQMHVDWMRRAWEGGLRVMSALAVNNMFTATRHVVASKRQRLGVSVPTDDRAVARLQLERLTAELRRPANAAWVEIARSPRDARRIVQSGKLAVVLGVELDLLGNFIVPGQPTGDPLRVLPADPEAARPVIAAELDELVALGVRQITPLHYVSGVFGGTAIFSRWFSDVNRTFAGNHYRVQDGSREGIRFTLQNDSWGTSDNFVRAVITTGATTLTTNENWHDFPLGQINAEGLTPHGHVLLEEMARRGLLIDIDHMGYLTTDQVIAKARAPAGERGLGGYPLVSSHSDFLELGLASGMADAAFGIDERVNDTHFGTTLIGNVRHEGMSPRRKVEAIRDSGGFVSPLLSAFRREPAEPGFGHRCDGSSWTWAQQYLHAVSIMGRDGGVALSTDRGFISFISPRFGIDAAAPLKDEMVDRLRRDVRRGQVAAQRAGVTYESPIRSFGAYRFEARFSGDTLVYDGFDQDIWKAVAAYDAGVNAWDRAQAARIPDSGDIGHLRRSENIVKGLLAESEAQLEVCCGATWAEQAAAWLVRHGLPPERLTRRPLDDDLRMHHARIGAVWERWQAMKSGNPGSPLRRCVTGERDWDVNIDGVAHYGMLPDFLQDLRAQGMSHEDLAPLFRSAEQYVRTWEACEERAAALRSR